MSLEVSVQQGLVLRQTLSAAAASGNNPIIFNAYNKNHELKSTTTPAPADDPIDLSKTMSGSADVIDFTAAPWAGDTSVTKDHTGNKLTGIHLNAPSDNAGPITVEAGSTNGYNLFGSSGKVVLYPGQSITMSFQSVASGLPAVSGTVKNIQFTGTASDTIEGYAFFS